MKPIALFFTYESINLCNTVKTSFLHADFVFFPQILNFSTGTPIHFIPPNVNSLLPKIDECRNIAKLSNEAFIGISESKLDDFDLSSDININSYNAFRCDQNRHGRGAVCYIRNDLSYDVKSFFPPEIVNIFFNLLLANTKPIVVVVIY